MSLAPHPSTHDMTTDPKHAPETDRAREPISALVDGALAPEALAAGFPEWADHPQARAAWREYHLIGEVLREGEGAAHAGSEDFARRVTQRLAAERLSAAPASASVPAGAGPVHGGVAGDVAGGVNLRAGATHAANDDVWHWRATALVASLVAVLSLGWNLWGAWAEALPGSQPLAASPAPMIRDAQLDEMLAAHRQGAAQNKAQAGARFDPIERVNTAPDRWRAQARSSVFQPVVCWRRQETDLLRLQCLYSDGQALVSVLAEPYDQQRHEVFAAAGSSPAQTRRIQDWWVTVMGEVPPHKLRAFAKALERQP